jgi:hypothetical protein
MFAGDAVSAVEEGHIGRTDSFGLWYFFVCNCYFLQRNLVILDVVVLESNSVSIGNYCNIQADLFL